MITVAWLNDERNNNPVVYLSEWNADESRQKAFLTGWTRFLKEGAYEKKALHWQTVGAYYASVFGDIEEDKRRKLYYSALAEFVKSQRCAGWDDEQRRQALFLARQAPGFDRE